MCGQPWIVDRPMTLLRLRLLLIAPAIVACGCSGGDAQSELGKSDDGKTVASKTQNGSESDAFEYLLDGSADSQSGGASGSAGGVKFQDTAESLGITHTYENGANGQLLMVESIGGGGAWFDLDRDGRLDLWLNQGGDPAAPMASLRPSDQLYRQSANGFRSVTGSSHIDERQYSQGTAVGDFDNDGFDDVYVTNVGRNTFWRNLGDGTFEETALSCGIDDASWSSSAAWADLDCDGDLDLYVCNYLRYDPYDPFECLKDGEPALCHPRQLDDWPDETYRNNGDGTFTSMTEQWSLSGPGNKGLGVAVFDMNLDGYPDIYVANDTTANFLFINQKGQGFEESALRLGCGLSGEGQAQASMGIAVGDYDGNAMPDVLLTHFTGETNTLFQNLGEYGLHDVSSQTGLRKATWTRLGFGTVMQDFDADGFQELIIANGHIDERNADGDGYKQKSQLLRFDGTTWNDISASGGSYFEKLLVGRGISMGDFDADGRPDLAVIHQNDRAAVLRNESDSGNWLRIELIGRQSNRRGIGCRIELTQGVNKLSTQLVGGSSFAVTHEPVVYFGLGDETEAVDLRIVWPGGHEQTLIGVDVNQTVQVQETLAEGESGGIE